MRSVKIVQLNTINIFWIEIDIAGFAQTHHANQTTTAQLMLTMQVIEEHHQTVSTFYLPVVSNMRKSTQNATDQKLENQSEEKQAIQLKQICGVNLQRYPLQIIKVKNCAKHVIKKSNRYNEQ